MKKTPITVVRELAKLNLNHDQMLVRLSSVGNPDYGQTTPQSERMFGVVSSFEQASGLCRAYIRHNLLGGGNWSGGDIYSGAGIHVASVSYNGRIWKAGLDWANRAEIDIDGNSADEFEEHYIKEFEAADEALYASFK